VRDTFRFLRIFRRRRNAVGRSAHLPAAYAEAQFASWVALPPGIGADVAPAEEGSVATREGEAILERYYRNQEC